MSYEKTTWADRIDDGNKYTVTDNGDGTSRIEYAGTVIQHGTPMNAQNLNKIENELEALDTGKVDKEQGKGLSSNDYTSAEKTKLGSISVSPYIYMTVAEYKAITPAAGQLYWVTGSSGTHGVYLDRRCVEGEAVVPLIMTVEIDQSVSDPSARCTYKDDAVWMTAGSAEWDAFFGHYPCILTNGVEGVKLDPDNYAKDINGSNVDITSIGSSDVMVCFPRLGLRISTTGSKVTVSMTNAPNDPNFEYNAHTKGSTALDMFYIGAYLGYVSSSKLYSLSGKTPTVSQTIGTFRTQAQARGTGYEQAAFYQFLFIQCAYLLKYKSTDSQTAVCMGYVKDSHSAATATGGANTYGMDCENLHPTQKPDKQHQAKCFGIEDIWGNLFWWIDGFYTDANWNIYTANSGFNDTGEGYVNNGQGATGSTQGYITTVQGSTKRGFACKTIINSSTAKNIYYCDWGSMFPKKCANCGGQWNDENYAGIFRFNVDHDGQSVDRFVGSRLMYY